MAAVRITDKKRVHARLQRAKSAFTRVFDAPKARSRASSTRYGPRQRMPAGSSHEGASHAGASDNQKRVHGERALSFALPAVRLPMRPAIRPRDQPEGRPDSSTSGSPEAKGE